MLNKEQYDQLNEAAQKYAENLREGMRKAGASEELIKSVDPLTVEISEACVLTVDGAKRLVV